MAENKIKQGSSKNASSKSASLNNGNSNDNGIISLVLGIVSILFCWFPLVGLVVAIIGLVYAKKQRKIQPNDIATGGFVTSVVGIVLGVLCTILVLFYIIFIVSIVMSEMGATTIAN